MECMCAQTRPWFILLYKRIFGNGVRTHINSKRKISSTVGSEEDRTCGVASCRTASPTHYQLSYSSPTLCTISTGQGSRLHVSMYGFSEDLCSAPRPTLHHACRVPVCSKPASTWRRNSMPSHPPCWTALKQRPGTPKPCCR